MSREGKAIPRIGERDQDEDRESAASSTAGDEYFHGNRSSIQSIRVLV